MQHIESFPFMYWPNSKPCNPINMYFLSVAYLITGDSLKTYASQLSHLVRFCGQRSISFEELNDAHIFSLSSQLQKEKARYRLNERARNHNTVRDILSRIIRFLLWYQKNFIPTTATPLIGEAISSPRIRIEQHTNQYTKGKSYYTHRSMPLPESREPKHPIALPVIEDIEQCIDDLSRVESQKKRTLHRYLGQPDFFIAQLEYIRVRRHFMIWMMKRTGLRPAEMVEISVEKHLKILDTKCIQIPTKKRRRHKAPLRKFSIMLKDATVFLRYLTSRSKYELALQTVGLVIENRDALFLGVKGEPIKKTSLERDFARLVKAAGHQDEQACFSMFRHRFITYEVIVHLKEFMNRAGKTAALMTSEDYESILKRVATKTGHGSVKSLHHYIDLAWREINVWGGVDKAIARLHAADRLFEELLALKLEIEILKTPSAKDLLQTIIARLDEIIKSNKSDHLYG